MSENFDKIKSIGPQKIHENTHISRLHVEAILNKDFEGMTKIQLLGFISILQREYSLDLDSLKDEALKYFQEIKAESSEEDVDVFLTPKRKKNFTPLYIIIVIIIFVSIMFMSMNSQNNEEKITPIDNSAIENAKSNIEPVASIVESINEVNTSVEPEVIEQEEIKSFKISPKVRVWLGYVDLSTYKKYQKIIKEEEDFDLDPSKDWLLSFGHGHINMEVDGVVTKYQIKKNVRFSYINSELKEINLEEFKALNKGSRW